MLTRLAAQNTVGSTFAYNVFMGLVSSYWLIDWLIDHILTHVSSQDLREMYLDNRHASF